VDPKAERVAKNDATFREANEGIAASARRAGFDRVPFICECAEPTCTTIVRLSLGEYEDVRASGTRFLIAPHHEATSDEHTTVVARADGYLIVEKTGEAAELAEQLDPRSAQR
jgi:hypothetical protein